MVKPRFALRAFSHGALVLCAGLLAACSDGTGEGNTLASIRITDASFQRPTGAVEVFQCVGNQLLLIGTFDDGSQENLTLRQGATWTSSHAASVQVSNGDLPDENGNVFAKGALVPTGNIGDSATITASFVGLTATQDVVVSPGRIEVSPTRLTIAEDTAVQLFATAVLGDGTAGINEAIAFNNNVTWTRSAGAAATVDAESGVVTAASAGAASFQASTGISCSTDAESEITVSPDALVQLDLLPTEQEDGIFSEVGRNTSMFLRLIGDFGSFVQDLTELATLTSSNSSQFSVSGSVLVAGNPAGNASTNFAATGPDGMAVGTVVPAGASIDAAKRLVDDGLSVEPSPVSLLVGSALDLDAVGDYSPDLSQNLYRSVTWSSSNTAVASINGVGRVTGLSVGSATITARRDDPVSAQTLTASVVVNVVERAAPPVTSLTVDCNPTFVAVGDTGNCRAFAALTGGGSADVTFLSIWSSSDPDVAEVSNAHPLLIRESELGPRTPLPGRIFSVGTGPATITASLFDADGTLLATGSDLIDNSGPPPPPDADGDGVADASDNCPNTPNASQANTDGTADGGDACDTDDDNDGDLDGVDNCPLVVNADQLNTDGTADGGDACDTDDDNDGDLDGADNCPLVANADQANFDGDSQGDVCDSDDDNDGIADGADQCDNTPAGTVVNSTGCTCTNLNPFPIGPRCLD